MRADAIKSGLPARRLAHFSDLFRKNGLASAWIYTTPNMQIADPSRGLACERRDVARSPTRATARSTGRAAHLIERSLPSELDELALSTRDHVGRVFHVVRRARLEGRP